MWGHGAGPRAGTVAAVLVVLVIAGIKGDEVARARSRYGTQTSTISSGVRLQRVRDRRIHNDIKVLVVRPQGDPTIDVALSNDKLPGHETTSSMASRHHAIAAINGDFTIRPFDTGSGRPIDTYAEDGRLLATPLIYGRNFSISRDETDIEFGHDRMSNWITQVDTGEQWRVKAVNPLGTEGDAFSIYTPAGGSVAKSPHGSCSARLRPVDPSPRWGSGKFGVERTYYVDKFVCRNQPVARRGGIVLATPEGSKTAKKMQTSLVAGENVTYSWSLKRYGVLDTIGGNPDLVENGAVSTGPCEISYFCRRNPRSGIGWKPDGTLLLVTVDGRSKRSVGMTPKEFARFFIHLGATWALNLDGGGSTTMVVRNRVINRPSSGYERPVGSSLLVLSGADPDEIEPGAYTPPPTPFPTPIPTPTSLPESAPTSSPRGLAAGPGAIEEIDGFQGVMPASCGALLDPGSTGGLLDALARGELGSRTRSLDDGLRFAVRVFRGGIPCS